MTKYPRCGADEKTTDPNWTNKCDGVLVPLSKVDMMYLICTDKGQPDPVVLTYGKWKCTKCGRVVE